MGESDDLPCEREIRESAPEDLEPLSKLYAAAFPDEDLLPLVKALLADASGVVSLVATIKTALVGHIIFTPCRVGAAAEKVALLGPLAVAPDWQRMGIGKSLIRYGLDRLSKTGVSRVFVLGDPAYYGRHGFARETRVAPPYPLPEEWRGGWQSISLSDTKLEGTLVVPAPWRRQVLWLP